MFILHALQYVASGLSLVAFVAATILLAYRARLKHRAAVIKSAPEKERLDAIATTAEFFRVDVSGLSRAQQQDIALTQINARARRDLLLAGLGFTVAVLLAAIVIVAIWASKPGGPAAIIAPSGHVVAPGRDIIGPVNIGLDENRVEQRIAAAQKPLTEQLEKLANDIAREKGVPIAPLKAILERLGEFNVSNEHIPARLAAQADAYLALQKQWRQVGASNSDLAAVRNRALNLMDTQGDLKGAKELLENARKELKAQNLLTEAGLIGDEAGIELLQFNYREAAQLYDSAARLVLFNLEASLSWRRKEADAFLRQGEEFADPAALIVAVKGYRIILEAAAQSLGTEARALVEKELCKALRILGDREDQKQGMDHLAETVVMCENALKVLTIERNPVDWAVTKNSLAVAVMSMGARTGASQPLRHAEGMFREVLAVNALSSDDASKTKANLGLALQRLGNFERNEKRFEEATQLFREALMELSPEREPMTWSAVQNNLGASYRQWGELVTSVPLLRQAEEAYEQALTVIPRERAPYRWAQITDNMALVLLLLGKCTSSNELLQNALKLANGALEIFRQAGSKPDIDRANIRRAAIEEALKGRSSKQNCAAI